MSLNSWLNCESFSDYFHEKLIFANAVPVAEEELLDYLIDGISETSLRNQARIPQFKNKSDLLSAFEKVSLKDDAKSENKNAVSKECVSETILKKKSSTRSTQPPSAASIVVGTVMLLPIVD